MIVNDLYGDSTKFKVTTDHGTYEVSVSMPEDWSDDCPHYWQARDWDTQELVTWRIDKSALMHRLETGDTSEDGLYRKEWISSEIPAEKCGQVWWFGDDLCVVNLEPQAIVNWCGESVPYGTLTWDQAIIRAWNLSQHTQMKKHKELATQVAEANDLANSKKLREFIIQRHGEVNNLIRKCVSSAMPNNIVGELATWLLNDIARMTSFLHAAKERFEAVKERFEVRELTPAERAEVDTLKAEISAFKDRLETGDEET